MKNEAVISPKKRYYYHIDHIDDAVNQKKIHGAFLVTHVSTLELVIASTEDLLQVGDIYTFLFRFEQVPYNMMGKVTSKTQRGERMEYIMELINPSNDYRKTIKNYSSQQE
ncbi:hypothetical protein [Isachenkonia alkalipeptolytica]|uniref:Uncharacterized protein n=1 Tax=Isachenkonia alkalipeptolytica TaxID=2565777 RepID=A0AA44BDG8_9CLOT|nr:hypothetical protein [Isachenkonia alkalipeptolytica]NBG87942.1 hypothetical protein [Isachenkonia alkalipeptolytica]